MIFNASSAVVAAILGFASVANAAPRLAKKATSELSLTAQLSLADTVADRFNLLPNDSDWTFDFNNASVPIANRKTFPAVVGTGGSLAVGAVPPCSMASLHYHPYAAEFFSVISGRIVNEMVPENGVVNANGTQRVIRADLGPHTVAVFPAGTWHAPVNPECEPAEVAVFFTSEDAGIHMIAPQLFSLDDSVLTDEFGPGLTVEEIAKIKASVPQGAAVLMQECAKKCGLQ